LPSLITLLKRYVRMVDAGIERTEVEQFLKTAITKVTNGIGGSPGLATQHIGKVSSRLVESVNAELSQACPSTDGFKFVVQAVVLEQWGQGAFVGGKCLWDEIRDTVVSVQQDTDKLDITLIVFFIQPGEEESESEEEG